MAYLDVELPNGDRSVGSAFHIGDGIFVTARHVVEGNKIVEIKITEPVGVSSKEFFRDVLKVEVTEEYIYNYDTTLGSAIGAPPLFKHYLRPLELVEGPYYSENNQLDVAAFRVAQIHPAAGIVKLGMHWDDWVYRDIWHLTDAIVLGYPPIPMTNEPALVAARAEINTFVVPRHAPAVHFILSAIPRGGFSGGVAIHESGNALGVVTSSLNELDHSIGSGFMAVLSIEAIVLCLQRNNLWPEVQKSHHRSLSPASSSETAKKVT
jgi:hypothetical protein